MSRIFKNVNLFRMYMNEEFNFINMMRKSYSYYCLYSSRSNKKVKVIHNWIKNILEHKLGDNYLVFTDKNIPALNASGRKNTDIVVFNKKTQTYDLAICVKFVCSNYKQNKNNYLENIIGETCTIKAMNPNIKVVSFNIFPSKCPYFKKNGDIKKIEDINYEKDLAVYHKHSNKYYYDLAIMYLLDIDYTNNNVIGLNKDTPYIPFDQILTQLNFFQSITTNIKPIISSF